MAKQKIEKKNPFRKSVHGKLKQFELYQLLVKNTYLMQQTEANMEEISKMLGFKEKYKLVWRERRRRQK